jgi:hypothetical protein
MGPGKIFEWNGKSFTTDRADGKDLSNIKVNNSTHHMNNSEYSTQKSYG